MRIGRRHSRTFAAAASLGFGLIVGAGAGAGCGGGGAQGTCLMGSERCACYRNKTCDDGLSCRSGLCVAGDSEGGAGPGGGTAGSTGDGGRAATDGGRAPGVGGTSALAGAAGSGLVDPSGGRSGDPATGGQDTSGGGGPSGGQGVGGASGGQASGGEASGGEIGSGGAEPLTGGTGGGGNLTTCGNGEIDLGEECDDGDTNGVFSGDGSGCSRTCTPEPRCRLEAGVTGACSTTCGDGNRDADEECDDGNTRGGDGCSSECTVEDGFLCSDELVSEAEPCPSDRTQSCLVLGVTYRDFEGQQEPGGHPDFLYYGASGTEGTPGVVPGATETTCVPNASGTKASFTEGDECPHDQAGSCTDLVESTLGPDGKPVLANNTCLCVFTDWDKSGLLGTCIEGGDCTPSLPSVETCYAGLDGERLRIETTVPVIKDAESFAQWYRDSSFSTKVRDTLELAPNGDGQFVFSSSTPGALPGTPGLTVQDELHAIFLGTQTTPLVSGFFPLEGQPGAKICNIWPYWVAELDTDCGAGASYLVPSQWDPRGSYYPGESGDGGPIPGSGTDATRVLGTERNFYFTTEVRYVFRYGGTAATLSFTGDDDIWVFVNGSLALDLGAPHPRLQGSVVIDSSFGLETGKLYELVVFHADRHPRESNFELVLPDFKRLRSICTPR